MGIEHLQNDVTPNDTRRGTDSEAWRRAFRENLFYVLGRFPATATANDKYLALAYSVRDRLLDRWVKTSETYYRRRVRTVCYLSAEFLLAPILVTISSTSGRSTRQNRQWTLDQAFADRVAADPKHDWNGGSGSLGGESRWVSSDRRYHRDPAAHEVGRQCRQATIVAARPAGRTPLEKLTRGLPKGSPSRSERRLNANRQSDSFTSLEIAPRNSNHIPGGTPQ